MSRRGCSLPRSLRRRAVVRRRLLALAATALALSAASGCAPGRDETQVEGVASPDRAAAVSPESAAKRPKPVIQVLGVHPVPGQSDVVLIEVRIDRPPGEVKPEEF